MIYGQVVSRRIVSNLMSSGHIDQRYGKVKGVQMALFATTNAYSWVGGDRPADVIVLLA